MDDTSSVWENHEENLFAVERYIYFPASRRQFNAKNRSMLEARRDETPSTGMLMTALNVLQRTHARFFRALAAAGGVERAGYLREGVRPPWDVREVLREERQQVCLPAQTWSCFCLMTYGIALLFCVSQQNDVCLHAAATVCLYLVCTVQTGVGVLSKC